MRVQSAVIYANVSLVKGSNLQEWGAVGHHTGVQTGGAK